MGSAFFSLDNHKICKLHCGKRILHFAFSAVRCMAKVLEWSGVKGAHK